MHFWEMNWPNYSLASPALGLVTPLVGNPGSAAGFPTMGTVTDPETMDGTGGMVSKSVRLSLTTVAMTYFWNTSRA